MPLVVTVSPNPFDPADGAEVTVSGGSPPYRFFAAPTPPGLSVDPAVGGSAYLSVPPGTPPGQVCRVAVSDSGSPQQQGTGQATTS